MNKIIIDTNLWISFLLSRKFDFLDNLLDSGAIELVSSEELLDELVNVASRPKLKKIFSEEDWDYVSDIIDSVAVFYPVTSKINICRDPKDNFLLALAQDSSADYLISGDNDLLVLKTIGRTQIISIAEFNILMRNI